MGRRNLVESDVRPLEDILLHWPGGEDLGRDAAGQDGAADLDQLARMGVGRQPQHHRDVAIIVERGAEDAAAAARRRVVVLDVVEDERLSRAAPVPAPRSRRMRVPGSLFQSPSPSISASSPCALSASIQPRKSPKATGLRSADMSSLRTWNMNDPIARPPRRLRATCGQRDWATPLRLRAAILTALTISG